jgi:MFS transporter, YNFM family, putative membrane transport protein
VPSKSNPQQGNATRAIALLSIAAFAAQAMVRVTDSLLPQIASDLNVTVGATSVIVTFYMLAHGSVQLVAGTIGDKFGKYLCAALAASVATVMVGLCGLATTLPALVGARIGSGLATGWIIPLALAFIGDVVPFERRQQAIGGFLSGQILGQLFGQAAGGILGDFFGWRNVFFLLAVLLAIATAGLFVELWRNPITRARNPHAAAKTGFVAGYRAVFGSAWARMVIAMAFLEFGSMFGAFTYVGADLHLRFGVSFTLVGIFVSAFAIGGLIYSLSVRQLVTLFGPSRLALFGGCLLAAAYVLLAVSPLAYIAPLATMMIGLGFYMLHNTLQTQATQMTPEARGTAVAVFSSALYLGQTAGVAASGALFDRFGAAPIFLAAAAILVALGVWCSVQIRQRSARGI